MNEDICARTPINKTAAIVTGKGFHYVPKKHVFLHSDSDLPLATRPIHKSERSQCLFVDMTGLRFGRLTVIGLSRDIRGSWVVKCDCGTYSHRKTRSLRNPKNPNDRCENCWHLAQLKRIDLFRRTGKLLEKYEF